MAFSQHHGSLPCQIPGGWSDEQFTNEPGLTEPNINFWNNFIFKHFYPLSSAMQFTTTSAIFKVLDIFKMPTFFDQIYFFILISQHQPCHWLTLSFLFYFLIIWLLPTQYNVLANSKSLLSLVGALLEFLFGLESDWSYLWASCATCSFLLPSLLGDSTQISLVPPHLPCWCPRDCIG